MTIYDHEKDCICDACEKFREDEYFDMEKKAKQDFRNFKKNLRLKFPSLFKAIKQHEKENDEKDILFTDLFCSKFADEVSP